MCDQPYINWREISNHHVSEEIDGLGSVMTGPQREEINEMHKGLPVTSFSMPSASGNMPAWGQESEDKYFHVVLVSG